jgi:hypothetical protein
VKRGRERERSERRERSQRYVVIGLGGVGSLVLRLLVQFLHSRGGRPTVLAVDGDVFEERNRERMHFTRTGPKAEVLARDLADRYGDRVTILPVPRYVTPRNVRTLIEEGDIVFCQPDNHATRLVVERGCARLRTVTLFTGGNDGVENGKSGTYGSVHVYRREAERELSNPLSRFHPEVARPADRLPTAQGCAVAMASAPQLLFTNATVAVAMLGAFYGWLSGRLDYEEVYFDILAGRMVPARRVVAMATAARRTGPRAGQREPARGAAPRR